MTPEEVPFINELLTKKKPFEDIVVRAEQGGYDLIPSNGDLVAADETGTGLRGKREFRSTRFQASSKQPQTSPKLDGWHATHADKS